MSIEKGELSSTTKVAPKTSAPFSATKSFFVRIAENSKGAFDCDRTVEELLSLAEEELRPPRDELQVSASQQALFAH